MGGGREGEERRGGGDGGSLFWGVGMVIYGWELDKNYPVENVKPCPSQLYSQPNLDSLDSSHMILKLGVGGDENCNIKSNYSIGLILP